MLSENGYLIPMADLRGQRFLLVSSSSNQVKDMYHLLVFDNVLKFL